ncbi:MAG TPA: type II secretion system protein [Candidatus Acidoferrum sp.]|nr:type II secretion system protein [Candidatus Acidoferrum sp.]
MAKQQKSVAGYSLIELMVATVLFTIIAGTVFSLLLSAQLRYHGESDLTNAFQQANVAMDQITRDVHSAGYPSPSSFSTAALSNPQYPKLMANPFAWSPGYTNSPPTPCTVGTTCGNFPGDYDMILETDFGDGNGVQWIRYSLQGTTLMRGMTPKVAWADPISSTTGSLLPYLENVQNGPGNRSLPIFSYGYGNANPPAAPWPTNIRQVNILLIVQSAEPDPQTRQFRTITLTGQAVRFN